MVLYTLTDAISTVGGFYNIALVAIVMIMFVFFLRKHSKAIYMKPWKLLFFALCVYIIEEISQILLNVVGMQIPKVLFPLYEMIMITTFIYMLLIQKEYMKTGKKRKW